MNRRYTGDKADAKAFVLLEPKEGNFVKNLKNHLKKTKIIDNRERIENKQNDTHFVRNDNQRSRYNS